MPDGPECWEEIGRVRAALKLASKDVGDAMGLSAGAVRGWESRQLMPEKAWRKFVARYYRELDPVDDEDDTGSASGVWMKKSDWALARRLGGGNKSAGVRLALQAYLKAQREANDA